MERRHAVTVAATAALTLLAGAGGIALSSGILATSHDGGAGTIRPVGAGTPPVTAFVDVPAPAAPTATPGATRSHGHERESHQSHDDGAHDDD